MYNDINNINIIQFKYMGYMSITRNPGLSGRMARNSPGILVFLVGWQGILVFLVGLLGFLQEYVGQGKVLQFKLEIKEVIYAVCPKHKCQSLYPPAYQKDSPIPHYPMFCTHKSFDGDSKCGIRISPWRFGDADAEVPIKKFVAFSFKDYIAELTSRSGDAHDKSLTPGMCGRT